MATPFVPGNGFAGFAQQTPAVQALLRKKRTTTKKRKKKVAAKSRITRGRPARRTPARKKAAPARRPRGPRNGSRGRLVKGSPAAKRRMAQLRKMRKT